MQGVQGSAVLEVQLAESTVWEREAELGELYGGMLRFDLATLSFQACLDSSVDDVSASRSLQIYVLAQVARLQTHSPGGAGKGSSSGWQADDARLQPSAADGTAIYDGEAVRVKKITFDETEGGTAQEIESQQAQHWRHGTTAALSLAIQHRLKDSPFMPSFVGITFKHRELNILHKDYSGGELLSDVLRRGAPGHVMHHIVLELLKALDKLGRQRVAFLNVRPENILLLGGGAKPKLKLLNWNNARVLDGEGAVACNASAPDWDPAWTPPETTSLQRCSGASDVYQFALLLWEMWTGETVQRLCISIASPHSHARWGAL
jgi:serine/threonine protein kinase